MNIAVPIDLAEDRPLPLPRCLGTEIGPAAVRERPKLVPVDFAPKAIACKRGDGECKFSDGHCDKRGKCLDIDLAANLATEIARNRLEEIRTLVRSLTFGEMHELADGIWGARPADVIESDALPGMLHRWSVSRK